MRAKALQIVLFLAAFCAAPSRLPASPSRHKAVLAAAARTKALRHATAGSIARTKTPHGAELKHAEQGHAAKRPEARPEERQEAPVPIVREAPDEEMLQVRHDRKQHFSSDVEPPVAEGPRKATAADFLTTFAEDAASNLKHSESVPAAQTVLKRKPAAISVVAAPASRPEPAVVVAMAYNKRGQLIVPPALKGSHEILVRQNVVADEEGLDRIEDDADLERLRGRKMLVPIPSVAGLQADERLPANRRYCRPWTAQFLAALARAHYARFHSALQVNSAVRTIEVQERLLVTNGNAAPAEGQTASPHLTGQAVDLAKRGLSLTEIAWLRGYLLPLIQAGKVDVEEEFQQSCFHISVYRKYSPQPAPRREIASASRGAAIALAAAVR